MAALDRLEMEHADRMAYLFEQLQEKAIAAKVADHSEEVGSLNQVVPSSANPKAASELFQAIDDAVEHARHIPTLDDGEGTGPVHRGYVNRLQEHGFRMNRNPTGEDAAVEIVVNEEGDTMLLVIGQPAQRDGN